MLWLTFPFVSISRCCLMTSALLYFRSLLLSSSSVFFRISCHSWGCLWTVCFLVTHVGLACCWRTFHCSLRVKKKLSVRTVTNNPLLFKIQWSTWNMLLWLRQKIYVSSQVMTPNVLWPPTTFLALGLTQWVTWPLSREPGSGSGLGNWVRGLSPTCSIWSNLSFRLATELSCHLAGYSTRNSR